jgi:hypothetical protein
MITGRARQIKPSPYPAAHPRGTIVILAHSHLALFWRGTNYEGHRAVGFGHSHSHHHPAFSISRDLSASVQQNISTGPA